ncbi:MULTISPECIES: transglycosylase domain-containing protein [Sphingomonas]|uniref:Penicillin-binding protein n=2 Tax=Sphingomonas adhaesiva TaxID=28212 RepID=A0A2A4I7G3_9SPHN|nr:MULTISPECIES: PBP1A family penicillin-binding protein [Sphingomonas]PCG13733.1 penicillin-binding protein [Sphingomonas adhaesiva]PZU77831.1 MAG: PBP1A family penicillin-binding protein [Sphingomonas sp.]
MARARSSTTRTAAPPAWRRRLMLAVKISAFLAVLGLGALVTAVFIARSQLPSFESLKSSPNGQMIRVHAADGSVLVSLGPSYGEWLPYDRIPAVMRDATIAVEDRRFRSHLGVDPIGIARSVMIRMERGRWVQGGSTVTQQLARNIFLNNQKKFGRKFREWILALALERKFDKDQILELYLNKVYYGGGAYGIDAASRKFFGHGADRLSLAEAAVIAGLVKAPSNYSPTADADAAKGRAGVVLQQMVRNGFVTSAQAASADPGDVKLAPPARQNSVRYFTDWALPQLDLLIDETVKPLEVWTTLDPAMQREADAAIRANVPKGAQGALVAIDRDGAVRAMVGGTDYVSSIYNRATQAQRQPGSAFKLFVYLAALEAGRTPEDKEIDEPVTIDGWSPRNDSRRNSGEVTLRTAFAYSLNTIAAKLGQAVGFQTVADMARRFGITTPVNTHPSMVLGTSDVRLIDMTHAFASVGNKGVDVAPFGITRVTADNETIYTHEVDRSRVLVAPTVAAQMTDLLQTAVNTGTGRAAQIGRPVAGKTGTTTSSKDGWFLGFSSGLTTGIWMGRDDARPIAGLHGGTAPARAFAQFMKAAVASRPIEQFDTQVTLPEAQLEPDAESYYGAPDNMSFVDDDGNPLPMDAPRAPAGDQDYYPDRPAGPLPPNAGIQQPLQQPQRPRDDLAPPDTGGERLDQDWLDRVTGQGQGAGRRDQGRDQGRDAGRDPARAQPPRTPPERPNQ